MECEHSGKGANDDPEGDLGYEVIEDPTDAVARDEADQGSHGHHVNELGREHRHIGERGTSLSRVRHTLLHV